MTATIHIVGAGLAGLAAATSLASSHQVIVHEAARFAGGRCRSYYDAALGLTIDNGNHLLLSGNRAAHAYLQRIGAQDVLIGPDECDFDFADVQTSQRWQVRPNAGRLPWWILSAPRRVPGTQARDYLDGAKLLRAGPDATIASTMRRRGRAWTDLWHPVFVSALNTMPDEASARLAAAVMRESLGAGGRASRPRVAREGLGPALVAPALASIERAGAAVRYGTRLKTLTFEGQRIKTLVFSDGEHALGPGDRVILAVPPWIAADLLPGLEAPTEFRSILNAHFACAPPAGLPLLTGLVGSLSEWLFAFPDRLSVTVSAADAHIERPREELAAEIWSEIAKVANLSPDMPPWQIVKEKRATFAATPAQDRRRPGPVTRWRNLWLAGDWTQTGLPATIEGAIRSGRPGGGAGGRSGGRQCVAPWGVSRCISLALRESESENVDAPQHREDRKNRRDHRAADPKEAVRVVSPGQAFDVHSEHSGHERRRQKDRRDHAQESQGTVRFLGGRGVDLLLQQAGAFSHFQQFARDRLESLRQLRRCDSHRMRQLPDRVCVHSLEDQAQARHFARDLYAGSTDAPQHMTLLRPLVAREHLLDRVELVVQLIDEPIDALGEIFDDQFEKAGDAADPQPARVEDVPRLGRAGDRMVSTADEHVFGHREIQMRDAVVSRVEAAFEIGDDAEDAVLRNVYLLVRRSPGENASCGIG